MKHIFLIFEPSVVRIATIQTIIKDETPRVPIRIAQRRHSSSCDDPHLFIICSGFEVKVYRLKSRVTHDASAFVRRVNGGADVSV